MSKKVQNNIDKEQLSTHENPNTHVRQLEISVLEHSENSKNSVENTNDGVSSSNEHLLEDIPIKNTSPYKKYIPVILILLAIFQAFLLFYQHLLLGLLP